MAISIIGTPQTANANNGGTVTCTFSTTPSQGDYTVAIIGSPAAGAAIGTISTSGYTLLTSHTGAAAANPSLAIWYKKQGSSPDTTVAGTSGNGSDTDSSMIAFVLRGVDGTTFSDATPTTAGETSSTNPDPASITGASSNFCTIVLACMTVTMDTAITAPSGYTGYSVIGNDTYDHTLAAAYKLDCNGTEAPASWTNWDTGLWYAITVAVKPTTLTTYTKTHTADALILSYEVVDQEQVSGAVSAGWGDATRLYTSQSWIPTMDTFTAIAFNFTSKPSYDVIVYFDESDSSHQPVHTLITGALYNFTITNANLYSGMTKYSLPVPQNLTIGTRYMIYLAFSGGTDYRDLLSSNTNAYANGRRLQYNSSTTSWDTPDSGNLDMNFRTYAYTSRRWTIDAYILAQSVKTNTVDAIIYDPIKTYTYTADAYIFDSDKGYTYSGETSLPTNADNLDNVFSSSDYTAVATDDTSYVTLTTAEPCKVFLFRNKGSSSTAVIKPTWIGQCSVAPTSLTVYLQIYNRTSQSWEDLDSDNTTAANTDFTLTGEKSASLTDYYDSSYWVICRVYQVQI